MTIFRCSVLVAAALAATPTYAQEGEGVRADRILSAGALQSRCVAADQSEVGRLDVAFCLGAISGIADAATTLIAFFRKGQSICFGTNDNLESMHLAFLSHLERNPDDKRLPAATVMMSVLAKQYPCGKGH